MALTQGSWSDSTVNGRLVSTCIVGSTTAENDAYTLKTSTALDPNKPFTLFYHADVTPDGSALPLDIWLGYDDSFVLSGDGATVTAGSHGAKFKEIFDDVVLAVDTLIYSFVIDPELPVADVVTVAAIATGPKVRVPASPYYAFNLNGASTLAAATHTFTIVQ